MACTETYKKWVHNRQREIKISTRNQIEQEIFFTPCNFTVFKTLGEIYVSLKFPKQRHKCKTKLLKIITWMLQSCLDASGTRASHGETLWTAVNTQGFIFHNMSRQWRAQPTFMWGLQSASRRSPNAKYSIILSIPSRNCNSFFVKRHGAISGCGHALYSFRPLLHNSSKCRDKFPLCLLHCFLCGATQGRHERVACFEMAVRSWKKNTQTAFLYISQYLCFVAAPAAS